MKRGRKPGYKHPPETIEKMRQAHQGSKQAETSREKIRQYRLGIKQSENTRKKISDSMKGVPKTEDHRDSISESLVDLERKCLLRFLELRSEYPGFEEFFDNNIEDLVFAMRDIKSEKELDDLRRYIESVSLQDAHHEDLVYHYSSSSCYAHEDVMISLIDAKLFPPKRTLLH